MSKVIYHRAPREAYARGCASFNGMECHIGMEFRPGDDARDMAMKLHGIAHSVLVQGERNHALMVELAEAVLKDMWPDRAYFIETDESGLGTQVFQPWGLPRNS